MVCAQLILVNFMEFHLRMQLAGKYPAVMPVSAAEPLRSASKGSFTAHAKKAATCRAADPGLPLGPRRLRTCRGLYQTWSGLLPDRAKQSGEAERPRPRFPGGNITAYS